MRSLEDDSRFEKAVGGNISKNNDKGILEGCRQEEDELRDVGLKITERDASPIQQDNCYFGEPHRSILSTFSSSGSFSPANEASHVSVATEDHDFFHARQINRCESADEGQKVNATNTGSLEEHLFDNDPVGLHQWQQNEQERQQISSQNYQEGRGHATNTNEGWCAGWSDNDNSPNSLQLIKEKQASLTRVLWSQSPLGGKMRNLRSFFPATPRKNVDQGDRVDHPPLGAGACTQTHDGCSDTGNLSSEVKAYQNSSDEEAGVQVQKHRERWMNTRWCKVLVFSLLLVVIGAIATAMALGANLSWRRQQQQASSGRNGTMEEVQDGGSPSGTSTVVYTNVTTIENNKKQTSVQPSSCIQLRIVMSTTSTSTDTNTWSLGRVSQNTRNGEVRIDSGDSFPELDGGSQNTLEHCVPPGMYTFTISDSGGNGLGGEGKGGYYVMADGITLGIR